MALFEPLDLFWFNILYTPLVNFPVRDQPILDEFPKPLGSLLVDLVVVDFLAHLPSS
jgi:hypothetical protein